MATRPDYVVDFRGRPACPCQADWIPVFERELQRRGVITGQVPIAQLIGGAKASGGTHGDFDRDGNIVGGGGVSDYWLLGVQGEVAVMVARQMGADPTWHRLKGWDNGGGSEHVHSVLRGCPHLTADARAQVAAVNLGGDGLVGSIPDPGPRPLSGRTWQQGIEWQRQQEDDMPLWSEWPKAEKDQFLKDVEGAARRGVLQADVDNDGHSVKGSLEVAGRYARTKLEGDA